MKALCTAKDLTAAVQKAAHIVRKKQTLPVLGCILITANETLTLTTTNLETAIEVSVESEIKDVGTIAIPADILLRAVQSMSTGKVELSVSNGILTISTTNSSASIKSIPHDDFPKIPDPISSMNHTLSAEELRDGLENTLFSVSRSTIRPELASVYIYKDPAQSALVFAGTDSFRLSERIVRSPKLQEFPETLIPLQNATDLLSVLNEGEVQIGFDEVQMTVVSGRLRFVSRVIEGTFPDYRALLSRPETTQVTVVKEELLSSLKRCSVFSNESQQVHLVLNALEKTFVITSQNAAVGETTQDIESKITGDDLEINFNLHYLTDCLSHIKSDSISLSFGGVGRPLIIRGLNDASYTYLVMPLNR